MCATMLEKIFMLVWLNQNELHMFFWVIYVWFSDVSTYDLCYLILTETVATHMSSEIIWTKREERLKRRKKSHLQFLLSHALLPVPKKLQFVQRVYVGRRKRSKGPEIYITLMVGQRISACLCCWIITFLSQHINERIGKLVIGVF
jgi:hypothetical protein